MLLYFNPLFAIFIVEWFVLVKNPDLTVMSWLTQQQQQQQLALNQNSSVFCSECEQRAKSEASGSAQGHHPAGSTNPPRAQLLPLGHHDWKQHGAALQ